MEYIEKVLGIKTKRIEYEFNDLPNYLINRYDIKMYRLDDKHVIFLFVKGEIEDVSDVKKHISKIKNIYGLDVVLNLDRVTYRQRECLIRERIAFIVLNKQIYLPFMAAYLQGKCDSEVTKQESLLPSTQLLLLYFIYSGARELQTSIASKELNLTPTSISRACRQIEQLNILEVKKLGVNKFLYYYGSPKDLFDDCQKYFFNPVKREVYVDKQMVKNELKSGEFALAEYSMLNEPKINCYLSDCVSKYKGYMSDTLVDSDNQVQLEFWRYDPKILTDGNKVDRLSLALSLKDVEDERVQTAIDEMLETLWRDLNG